ncbi:hypothetical protein Q7C18_00245 [Nesterenkonia sp. CL21]|uniref:type II secretion system F family protein n=1 Tax=Nesterenkonia sp. CL21 TaxID=3064894 RepID=UPI00287A0076|nr:hypothetical protein [Nesterenkonia sp. CL21]MDS2171127.1 hypothetical protein [Nesterenkonia sp. CL21]
MIDAVLLISAGTLAAGTVLLLLPGAAAPEIVGEAAGPMPGQIRRVRGLLDGVRGRLTGRARGADVIRESATLLRQLAALLQSGRGPGRVWDDLARRWAMADRGSSSGPAAGVATRGAHPLAQVCARAAAADRMGRGAADGLERFAGELQARLTHGRAAGAGSARGSHSSGPRRWGRAGGRRGPVRSWVTGSRREDQRLLDVVGRLAGLLRLSEETGAPLSRLVEELAATLDDDGEAAAAIASAAAGPRLTQRVLAGLPLGGVLVGQLIGADAVAVLLGSALGAACLVAGAVLMVLGMLWSRRMIQAVESHA